MIVLELFSKIRRIIWRFNLSIVKNQKPYDYKNDIYFVNWLKLQLTLKVYSDWNKDSKIWQVLLTKEHCRHKRDKSEMWTHENLPKANIMHKMCELSDRDRHSWLLLCCSMLPQSYTFLLKRELHKHARPRNKKNASICARVLHALHKKA